MRNSNCFYLDLFLSKRSTERWFLITRIYHILKQNNNNFESGYIFIKTATIPSKTNEILGESKLPLIQLSLHLSQCSVWASKLPLIRLSLHISPCSVWGQHVDLEYLKKYYENVTGHILKNHWKIWKVFRSFNLITASLILILGNV